MKKNLCDFIVLMIFYVPGLHAQFPEDFENDVPPSGWAAFEGMNGLGTDYGWTASSEAHNGNQAASVRYENVTSGTAEDWLVTPQFVPTSTTNRLNFYQKQTFPADLSTTYTVRVSTASQTTHTDFTIVDTQSETDFFTSYTLHSVDLSVYTGQAIYVAFVMENDNGDYWFIDEVSLSAFCNENIVIFKMFDTAADGWDGATYAIINENTNTTVGSGTLATGGNGADSYCLVDGCYSVEVTEGDFPDEISWSLSNAATNSEITSGFAPATTANFTLGAGTCPVPCSISAITDGGIDRTCEVANNLYAQDVVITSEGAPSSGTLDITADGITVNATITTSPQIVTIEDLTGGEGDIDVTATFSENTDCTLTTSAVFTAPASCSPTNDDCFSSTDIGDEITNEGVLNWTSAGAARPSIVFPASCTTSEEGVWFSFNYATETETRDITLTVDNDHGLYVYTGTCGNLSCVANNAGSPGDESYTFTAATISNLNNTGTGNRAPQNYFIFVAGNNGPFELDIVSSILPVTLSYFMGQALSKGNLLQWETTTELHTETHIIERSPNGRDDWVKIGSLAAAGTSNMPLRYEWMDNKPLPLSYYRLKSVDFDGHTDISATIVIESQTTTVTLSAYPVPTENKVLLQLQSPKMQIILLYLTDVTGRLIKTIHLTAAKGINTKDIDMSHLANGVYFLAMDNGGEKILTRLIKQ